MFTGVLLATTLSTTTIAAAQTNYAPRYKVDASWPKPLPNEWIMGQVAGLTVDKHDHIWVLQRPRRQTKEELGAEQNPQIAMCCRTTPAVLVFDTEGNLLKSWGGPGFVPDWPELEHSIWVDGKDNVWIAGEGPADRHVLKFNNDGKQLLEIGHPTDEAKSNQNTAILGKPAGLDVDDAAREIYIADGYLNNRVVVYDSETGAFKRGWGAYGISLSEITNPSYTVAEGYAPVPGALTSYDPKAPPSKQFGRFVHCVRRSNDGLVYVCDRGNNRIQVFTKAGKFVKEFFVRPETLFAGSTWTITMSHDAKQKYLLVADGTNNVVWVLERDSGKIVSSFGRSGRQAGEFHWVHQASMDSKGNYYTGEVDNAKRIQKFRLQNSR
jgi:hypothetical protein